MSETGNTLRVDFSAIPSKFPLKDMIAYIMTNLQLRRDHIERFHFRPSSRNIFIDMKDQAVAVRVVSEHNPMHMVTCDGKHYQIPVSMNDGSIVVKLHDLSPSVTDREIVSYMSRHGTVISIGEGRWTSTTPLAGLLNGYRFVRMIVTDPVPKYVEIAGEQTFTSYHGHAPMWRNRIVDSRALHNKPSVQDRAPAAQQVSVNRMSHMAYTHDSPTPPKPPVVSTMVKPSYDGRNRSPASVSSDNSPINRSLARRTVIPLGTDGRTETLKRRAEKLFMEHLKMTGTKVSRTEYPTDEEN